MPTCDSQLFVHFARLQDVLLFGETIFWKCLKGYVLWEIRIWITRLNQTDCLPWCGLGWEHHSVGRPWLAQARTWAPGSAGWERKKFYSPVEGLYRAKRLTIPEEREFLLPDSLELGHLSLLPSLSNCSTGNFWRSAHSGHGSQLEFS